MEREKPRSNPMRARRAPVSSLNATSRVAASAPKLRDNWRVSRRISVIARIARGGPFEHRQDGSVFQNRERRLPSQPRGWYREYTVETPGSDDRGARRIVTGGTPPSEYWYSDDHYRSFRRIDALGASR